MNCPNCGTNINQGENFCRMCGTQVVFQNEINSNVTPNAFEQKPMNEQIKMQENNITQAEATTNLSNVNDSQVIKENIPEQVTAPIETLNNTPNAFNQKPMNAESIIEQNQTANATVENQTNIQPINQNNNINTQGEIQNTINQTTTEYGLTPQNQINTENNISSNPIDQTPIIVPIELQNATNTPNQTQQVTNIDIPSTNNIDNNIPEEKTGSPIDDALLDAYIGVNVEKLKGGSFSWSAILFGIEYTLYRKMWFLSVIWFVGLVIIAMFLPSFSTIISFIVNFVIALQFKDWYVNHAKEKIKKIKLDNPNASEEELLKICRKKGGTSILAALSPFIILIILYFAATMLSGKLENSKVNTSEYLRTNIIREKI